jgi:putative ABC transport system permease protein
MISNYLKIATRNILKRKLYSFINAFGLSIGIAFCMLIYLFILDEKSFDQFHANKEVIYRMHAANFNEEAYQKGEKEVYNRHAYLPGKLADVMLDELAEIQHVTRFVSGMQGIFRYQDKIFTEKAVCVDSGFFKMFSFPLIKGDIRKVFKNPSDAVLTEEIARKYFGEEDPIGKIFTFSINEEQTFTVSGVIASPPANSSLQFKMLIPVTAQPGFTRNREQWGNFSYPTFVQLLPGTHPEVFKTHLDTLVEKYMGDRFKKRRERDKIPAEYKVSEFGFIPLTGIHQATTIGWEKVSDPKYSWILGGIAVLILVIACINYISLALTTSASRRVEVGIRKVVGAHRGQLIYQFGLESIVLTMVSMIIGMVLSLVFLPAFNAFTGKGIEFGSFNLSVMGGMSFLLTLIVGVLAGSYPSFFLSRFLPVAVLKGRFTSRVQASFTKPLVVFQFFLSASLIICSVIMMKQMNFIATKDLGYNKEQVITMNTQTGWSEEANQTVEQFRNALTANPAVLGVAGTTSSFNQGWSRYGYKIKDETKAAYVYGVDTHYVPLLELELVAGRNFDAQRVSDSTVIIVNEALVKDMGWTDPLNEHLNWREDTVGIGSAVIGVLKDYHFLSLEQEIEPMFISMDKKNIGYTTSMLIRVKPGNVPETIESIKKTWTQLYPDRPFEYTFVDADVAKQYESYERWMNITGLSTAFAILIACLGLFGLAGINAMNRTKEIGIRKVMGAELQNIFILLNRQYVWLALIAFLLAAPVSWYVMNQWLDSFQFKIVMGWELFAISMCSGLFVALITVSYHAIKAALINPAETLKYE